MEENALNRVASESLGRLAPELDELLRSRARVRRLEKRQRLYSYGSPPDAIFCVQRGLVRLSVTAENGREAVLSVVEAGHWFGEVSLFSNAPRVHNAVAVADSELLVLPAADFHDIVDQNPAFLMEFLRLVSNRYKSALQRVDAIILFPFPVRLARRLVADIDAQLAHSNQAEAVLKLSQENLGQMLGVARQSVNRQLREWETQGILRLEYGRIVVVDKMMLHHLADAGDE
jgi:CRP/FNR family cyclic AMP-dependent transcriptional regulator